MWILRRRMGRNVFCFVFFLSNCCSIMISKLLLARRGRWWLWGRQGCRFLTGDQRGRGSAGTSLWGWPHGLGLRNPPIIFKPNSGPTKTGSIHGWRTSHHGSFKSGFLDFFQQPSDPYLLFLSSGGHQKHILSSSGVIADLTGGYPRLPTHKAGLVWYNMFFVKFSPTSGTF